MAYAHPPSNNRISLKRTVRPAVTLEVKWGALIQDVFFFFGRFSPQSSHIRGCLLELKPPCVSLLWPILILIRHFSHWQFSHTLLCNVYILFIISYSLFACVVFHFLSLFPCMSPTCNMHALRSFLVCSVCVGSARVVACTADLSAVRSLRQPVCAML